MTTSSVTLQNRLSFTRAHFFFNFWDLDVLIDYRPYHSALESKYDMGCGEP